MWTAPTVEMAWLSAPCEAFILSCYPHTAEGDLFSRSVLPNIHNVRLEFEPHDGAL